MARSAPNPGLSKITFWLISVSQRVELWQYSPLDTIIVQGNAVTQDSGPAGVSVDRLIDKIQSWRQECRGSGFLACVCP